MDKRLLEALWRKAVKDFPFYAWGQNDFQGFAFTQDEHDEDNALKHLPDRESLRALNWLYENSDMLVMLKSRQLMCSWFFSSRILWECFQPGRRWLVCCRLEEAADHQLSRMWTQYQQIPDFLRPKATRKEANIVIHHPNGAESRIQAAAQNTDAPVSYTFTGVWIDEAPKTDRVQELVATAAPTTMAGGRLILTGTPVGKDPVYDLLCDKSITSNARRLEFAAGGQVAR